MGRSLQPRLALALVTAGCGNGGKQQQYEKLRTQACPISAKRCQVAVDRSPATQSAPTDPLGSCIERAVKNIPESTPPKHARGKAQIDAWLARNSAAMQNAIGDCTRRYGNGVRGYGRAHGYGYESSVFPSAIASMTGEAVDVVIG